MCWKFLIGLMTVHHMIISRADTADLVMLPETLLFRVERTKIGLQPFR